MQYKPTTPLKTIGLKITEVYRYRHSTRSLELVGCCGYDERGFQVETRNKEDIKAAHRLWLEARLLRGDS
jgi:hypothetical protein